MGMLLSVSSTSRLSCVLAPLTVMPIGIPAPSVSNDRLVPDLARSVGFGPVFPPSKRCFGHCSIHALPFPLDALKFVVFLQRHAPKPGEDSFADQSLKVPVETAPRTELDRGRFPLAAGTQHIKDTVDHLSPCQRLAAGILTPPFAFRQHRLQALPQRIGNSPIVRNPFRRG